MTLLGEPTTTAVRPIRILQVVQRFFPELGGTETHIAEVSRRLVREPDIDLTVLATDRTGTLERSHWMDDGYFVMRRRSWPRTADLYFSPGIVPVIRNGPWDLVHFQGIHTLVPPVGMSAAISARVPFVLTFHSGGHSSAGRSATRAAQWKAMSPLLFRARHLIAVSRFERRHFSRVTGIPASRFTVIPNGGALPLVSDVRPVPGRLITSGRLEKYKGHHLAIEALAVVRRVLPYAHLVILGSGGYRTELEKLAASLGVMDAVRFGSLPPADRAGMARELGQASVMTAFSSYEAHPVAVMEALNLGLKVVAFDAAGNGDLVEDGLVHGVSPSSSPEQLGRALVAALREVEARGQHQPAAIDLPTWESSASTLAQVYRRALAR